MKFTRLKEEVKNEIIEEMIEKEIEFNEDNIFQFLENFRSMSIIEFEDDYGAELMWDITMTSEDDFEVNIWEI